MPSELPSKSNGYQWPDAPARAILDRAASDSIFGDIHARLVILEELEGGIEALQAELQTFGVQRLNDAINPLIVSTQATLDQLVIDLAEGLTGLNSDIATAQSSIDILLGGGVEAININVASIPGFASDNAQSAFAELITLLAAEKTARITAEDALSEEIVLNKTSVATLLKYKFLG